MVLKLTKTTGETAGTGTETIRHRREKKTMRCRWGSYHANGNLTVGKIKYETQNKNINRHNR